MTPRAAIDLNHHSHCRVTGDSSRQVIPIGLNRVIHFTDQPFLYQVPNQILSRREQYYSDTKINTRGKVIRVNQREKTTNVRVRSFIKTIFKITIAIMENIQPST